MKKLESKKIITRRRLFTCMYSLVLAENDGEFAFNE